MFFSLFHVILPVLKVYFVKGSTEFFEWGDTVQHIHTLSANEWERMSERKRHIDYYESVCLPTKKKICVFFFSSYICCIIQRNVCVILFGEYRMSADISFSIQITSVFSTWQSVLLLLLLLPLLLLAGWLAEKPERNAKISRSRWLGYWKTKAHCTVTHEWAQPTNVVWNQRQRRKSSHFTRNGINAFHLLTDCVWLVINVFFFSSFLSFETLAPKQILSLVYAFVSIVYGICNVP